MRTRWLLVIGAIVLVAAGCVAVPWLADLAQASRDGLVTYTQIVTALATAGATAAALVAAQSSSTASRAAQAAAEQATRALALHRPVATKWEAIGERHGDRLDILIRLFADFERDLHDLHLFYCDAGTVPHGPVQMIAFDPLKLRRAESEAARSSVTVKLAEIKIPKLDQPGDVVHQWNVAIRARDGLFPAMVWQSRQGVSVQVSGDRVTVTGGDGARWEDPTVLGLAI